MRKIVTGAILAFVPLLVQAAAFPPHQGFEITTDRTVYDPGAVVRISFTYRVGPKTALGVFQLGELGCNYNVTLETVAGDVLVDLGGAPPCLEQFDCNDQPVQITRDLSLTLPADLGCGVYRVRAAASYLLLTPGHPHGVFMSGPEAVVPIVVCEDTDCQ